MSRKGLVRSWNGTVIAAASVTFTSQVCMTCMYDLFGMYDSFAADCDLTVHKILNLHIV